MDQSALRLQGACGKKLVTSRILVSLWVAATPVKAFEIFTRDIAV